MAIQRLRRAPHPVTFVQGALTLYEVELSAAPSRPWRAAFLRPPPALTTARFTPELGRLELNGATVHFRTIPARLHAWLRRIDRWIAYANSVAEDDHPSLAGRGGCRMRLIISGTAGDIWGRLEAETSDEIVALERSVARGEWTIGRGAKAFTKLRALAERLGYPGVTEEREGPAAPSSRLVVVQRGETPLAERLRVLEGPGVPVILDRRRRERRTAGEPIPIDRRRQDRRRLPPATWSTLRFLVHLPIWLGADPPRPSHA